MSQDLKINSSTVTPIEYKGQRVVTFKMIEEIHQLKDGNVNRNFTRNKERFIEGKHYFTLSYQEVIKLGQKVNVSRNGLTILTERGYLLITKSLTDDKAWDVQEQLVDSYFIKLESKLPTTHIEAVESYLVQLKQNEVLKIELDTAIKTKAHISDKKTATAMSTAAVATKENNKLKIELDQSLQYATVKKMQIKTGKTYKWQLLKKAGTELGIKPKKVPDINYDKVNAYHKTVWMKAYNLKID